MYGWHRYSLRHVAITILLVATTAHCVRSSYYLRMYVTMYRFKRATQRTHARSRLVDGWYCECE